MSYHHKAASKTSLKKLLSTSALIAVGIVSLSSLPAHADNAWVLDQVGGSFDTDTSIDAITQITQNSSRAIGQGNLDIAAHQTVNIHQNSSSDLFVARDNKSDPTKILGNLNANGRVMVIDGNGVFFSHESVVNVGSIIVSTNDISNAEIMSGRDDFVFDDLGDADASIALNGTINIADAGLAAFVSPLITNNGVINAKLGTVAFAAGQSVTLDLYGDGLMEIAVNGELADALLENTGQINAEGGTVQISALAAKDAVDSIINVEGLITVSSVEEQGGQIILSGGDKGTVSISGTLDASGTTGGDIKVTGQHLVADSGAALQASGTNGGGTILFGGEFQGGGDTPTSQTALVAQTATLSANADADGNGGEVVVWSDDSTEFYGSIEAKGGANSGNGGLVEVSGSSLLYQGTADTTALNGNTGWLLLDPLGIRVFHSAADNIFLSSSPVLAITDTALNTSLGLSNVLLATSPSQATYEDVGGGGLFGEQTNPIANDDNITVEDGVDIDTGANTLYFSTSTLNLYSTIIGNVSGGVGSPFTPAGITLKDPTTVNVFTGATTQATIQQGIDIAAAGAAINIGNGTYAENITIDKNLIISGASTAGTIITPASNTGSSGDSRGWWLIESGADVDISDMTFDGAGFDVWQALRHKGAGSVNNAAFKNIAFNSSGPHYAGTAIAAFGDGAVDITNSTFDNIGRIGAQYFGTGVSGSTFSDNSYTGKGAGDWLDYGVEVGGGAANIQILDSTIQNNIGVASVDGSISAGILLTTFFGAGTSATIAGTALTDNTVGVNIGFNASDSTAVTFGAGNIITGGDDGLRLIGTNVDIVGNTLSDIVFGGQSDQFVSFENGALFAPGTPSVIDGTGVTWGAYGLLPTGLDSLAAESKITHYLDDPTLGLINTGALAVSNGNSIQLAVNAAGMLTGPQTLTVDSGTFGGSVELWVDDLTINGQGAATIIDTDAIDAFANNGDANNGFQIAAISATSGGGDVNGVTVDGFNFDTLTSTGTNTGIELGESGGVNSAAINTTARNNTVNDTKNGMFSNLTNGTTTIEGNTMTLISNRAINFDDAVTAGERIILKDNNASSARFSVVFDSTVSDATIQISGNSFESTGSNDAVIFDGTILNSDVTIGGANPADANDIVGFEDGIDVATIDGGTFTITGNTRIAGNASDGLEFEGDIKNGAVINITNNQEVTGANDGVSLQRSITGSTMNISGNATITGTNRAAIRTTNINASTFDVKQNGTLTGATNALEFTGSVIDTSITVAGNDEIRGTSGDGVLFNTGITNATITIGGATAADGNALIIGGEDALDIESINGGTFTVANNAKLEGTNGDAIKFAGLVSNSATLSVHDNSDITGGTNGISFANAANGGSMVSIENNVINGGTNNGITFSGEVEFAQITSNQINNAGVNGLFIGNPASGDIALDGNGFTGNTVGARFEGGLVDLSGNANIFYGGTTGLEFDGDTTAIVGNTLGTTRFTGQTGNYIELSNRALFAPGTPTVIDALSASFDGLIPTNAPTGSGILTKAEYNALEGKIVHFNDDATLGFFDFGTLPDLNEEDFFISLAGFTLPPSGVSVTILGLPRASLEGGALNAITPAGGGVEESGIQNLANLEPAAGGQDTSCWGDAIAAAGRGVVVSYSYGGTQEESLAEAGACLSSGF
tara:strand:- start:98353 stop:103341 length:4989 start_codon:yes stop_codon:yes gene_type:complete